MPDRRYEVRVTGRLSERARDAFDGVHVDEVTAETVISGVVQQGHHLHEILEVVQRSDCGSCPCSRSHPDGRGLTGPARGRHPGRPGHDTRRSACGSNMLPLSARYPASAHVPSWTRREVGRAAPDDAPPGHPARPPTAT